MYTGHAGLALVAKAWRPQVPMALLVVAAFAPDWVEWLLDEKTKSEPLISYISHSIPAVVAGASVIALVYLLILRRWPDALVLAGVYLSHWPADIITGRKPTWSVGSTVGLGLYVHPRWDFLVEAALVLACAAFYWRSLPAHGRRRPWLAALVPGGLVALQAAFDVLVRRVA